MTDLVVWLSWTAPLAALLALVVWRDGEHRLALFAGGALTFAALLILTAPTTYRHSPDALAAKAIALAALALMSVVDAKTRLVPREFSWAWLLAGGVTAGTRFVQVQDVSVAPYWLGFFALWQVGILGGGDAKLLLGAFGLWPDPALLWFVVGVTLARGLVFVAWRYRGQAVRRLAQVTAELAGQGFGVASAAAPIQATFAATWAYALAVGLYVWRLG